MVYIQITELIFSNNEDIRELKFSLLEYMENLNTYLEDAERIKYLFFQPVYMHIYILMHIYNKLHIYASILLFKFISTQHC